MTDEPSKVVPFPVRSPDEEDTVAEGVRDAGPIPTRTAQTEPEQPRPIWAAVVTFLSIASVALVVAVLLPPASGGGMRWATGFAFLVAAIMGFAAVLYARVRDFWR